MALDPKDISIPQELRLTPVVQHRSVEKKSLELKEEDVVEIPKIQYVTRVVEVPQIQYVERIVEVPVVEEREEIVEVPEVVIEREFVEVPQIKVVEKIVHVPRVVVEERVIKKPRVVVKEKLVEVPVIIPVEKVVDVVDVKYRLVPVEKIVEVPEVRTEYVVRDVAKPQVQYRTVYIYKHVEERFIEEGPRCSVDVPGTGSHWERFIYRPHLTPKERYVPVYDTFEKTVVRDVALDRVEVFPRPCYRTTHVKVPVAVPMDRYINVDVPVEIPSERVVEVPKRLTRRVERAVDVKVHESAEPLVEVEGGQQGLIPFSEWKAELEMKMKTGEADSLLPKVVVVGSSTSSHLADAESRMQNADEACTPTNGEGLDGP